MLDIGSYWMFKVDIISSIDCPGVDCGASMSMRLSTRVGGGGDSNVEAEGSGLLLPGEEGDWRELPAVRDNTPLTLSLCTRSRLGTCTCRYRYLTLGLCIPVCRWLPAQHVPLALSTTITSSQSSMLCAWAERTRPAYIMHWVALLIGVVTKANKKAPFVTLVGHIPDSKHTEAHFSPNSLWLLVAQIPRHRDMAIFLLTTTTITTIRSITLPPCTCVWGNYLTTFPVAA